MKHTPKHAPSPWSTQAADASAFGAGDGLAAPGQRPARSGLPPEPHASPGHRNTLIPFYDEREPNNDPYAADFIGYVDSDSHLIVGGFVDDYPGPGDIYDHFEFVTSEAASFEVLLSRSSAWNDMALGVFDPDTGEMVMWIDDPGGAQWADFTVHARQGIRAGGSGHLRIQGLRPRTARAQLQPDAGYRRGRRRPRRSNPWMRVSICAPARWPRKWFRTP
ncbi:MAG: hypothetical protein R3F17_00660 [Planctomycetota bacterium]